MFGDDNDSEKNQRILNRAAGFPGTNRALREALESKGFWFFILGIIAFIALSPFIFSI